MIGNAQNATKSLTALVNAQRTAESLARNLDEIDHVIAAQEYREQLRDAPNLDVLGSHYAAAETLRKHHEEFMAKLSSLSADVGLLQIELPGRDLTADAVVNNAMQT